MGEAFVPLALFGLLVPVLLLGLIVLAVVAIAARGDADPGGERPRAMYLTAVSFVTLFLTLFAAFAVVGSVVGLAMGDDEVSIGSEFEFIGEGEREILEDAPDPVLRGQLSSPDADNERYRTLVLAGLIAVLAGALYVYHRQRLAAFARWLPVARGAGRKAWDAYLHTVVFVAIFVALFATVATGYAIFETLAPGTAGVDGREDGVEDLIPAVALALGSFALFVLHWREANRPDPPSERIVIEPDPPPQPIVPTPAAAPRAPDVEFAPPEPAAPPAAPIERERPIRRRERPLRPPRNGE